MLPQVRTFAYFPLLLGRWLLLSTNVCTSLAGSVVYEALASGKKIGTGGVPRAPGRPTLYSLSRSSFMVQWAGLNQAAGTNDEDDKKNDSNKEEEEEEECAPVIGYWIAYQPGGNTNVGFVFKKFVPEEKCLPSCHPRFKVITP